MRMRQWMLPAIVLLAFATGALAFSDFDFGLFRDHQLDAHSPQLFGIVEPIAQSSTASVSAVTAEADPTSLIAVAKGLKIRVVSAAPNLGPNMDMMALWPNDLNPTHLIACNEQGPAEPAVQRIRISDGFTETILTGMTSCDPAHRTPWGTIIVGEEAGPSGASPGGWLLEIINPLGTTNVLFDRATGMLSGANAGNVATRPAVGRLAFEGIAIYPNGVMYYGDENRPLNGTPGGAYFNCIPGVARPGGPPITNLADSPLVSGSVFGLRLGKRQGNTDYGQGSNTGLGTWIPISSPNNANLRAAAASLK